MTKYESDEHRTVAREWVIAILAVAAWFLLATNSADAQTAQLPDFIVAQVLGHAPNVAHAAPAEKASEKSMSALNLVAQDMRSRFQDQLVAGVARPSVELQVHFGFDSDVIDNRSRPQIEAAAQVLNQDFPGIRFRVAGFTDAAGDELYNQDLSQRRASAVWRELVKAHGVSSERLETVGYGEEDPSSEANAAQRRRVELQILRSAEGTL